MLSETVLYIRCDYTPTVGAGHLMRCSAIAEAWSADGGRVVLLGECANLELHSRSLWQYIAFKAGSLDDDLQATLGSIDASGAHAVVVDGYQFDAPYLEGLAADGRIVLFIDDLGKLARYPVDLILNQNLTANDVLYPAAEGTKLLLGPNYFLLRRELVEVLKRRARAPRGARNILVTFGLGPDEGVLSNLLQSLGALGNRDLSVRIVIPPEFPPSDQLVAETARTVANLELLSAPQPMGDHYEWADIAISGAGTTALELAAMGVPTIVASLADNQLATAKRLEELGVACFVGPAPEVSADRLRDALSSVLADSAKRSRMVKAGSELVDGSGAGRVVKSLRELIAEEERDVR